VARFVRIARKQRLDYDGFLYVCQQARRKLGLRKPKKERRLPQLLSEGDLKRFFAAYVLQMEAGTAGATTAVPRS
jgi:hypothetical protein